VKVKKRTIMRKILLAVALISFSSFAQEAEPIVTQSTTDSKVQSETTLKSPPASAISPTLNISGSDMCTIGVAGAVQTQILGISAGSAIRDMNCERLKNAKTLYDMGMKVAAVATMCQDERVFDAMMNAGTPCPKDGLIGDAAKAAWELEQVTKLEEEKNKKGLTKNEKTAAGGASVLLLLLFLL
jgi:hypothetical protein